MTTIISGDTGISPVTASGTSASVDGMTVGRGGGEVSTNTAVGASALNANTSGATNTAIGTQALNKNTTGNDNSAVGLNALYSNTTGSSNTSIGRDALALNTTASNNTAVGYQAGYTFASTGTAPITAFGYQAAYSNNSADPRITAIGYQALYTNNGSSENTAVGWGAAKFTTTGSGLVAVGNESLSTNTTGSSNTAVGYQALTANTTGIENTAIGYRALTANTTASYNTAVGRYALYLTTTGTHNTCIGHNSGYNISTGTKNTILGRYDGNQGGLDIRTASNAIVLSDGDGNPRLWVNGSAWTYGGAGGSAPAVNTNILQFTGDIFFYAGDAGSFNAANAVLKVQKVTSTGRSINAAGTINASGADYAEYMTKCGDFTVAKGDVVGINSDGKLTNVFADAISFVVKSTDPSYVGGDSWGAKSQNKDDEQYTPEELEAQRQMVDRIAFSGQVPVNVTGATAGQYIIPVNDNGAIKGQAVSNPTFEQYQLAVGKVVAIESDGRAKIIVKVA